MQFRYRAVRADGQIQRGILLAAHPADLRQRLARTGLTLLAWQAQSGLRADGWAARVSRRDVIHFCFYLEQLTRAGVPLLDGLRDLRDSVGNPRLRDVVASLVEEVQGGQQLSQALAAHPAVFSPLMVGLVAAGELAGTLADVLQDSFCMEDTCETQDDIRRMRQLLDGLPARERQIILLRYGLSGQPPLTQLETAKLLDISRSYVSRLETHALELLRQRWDVPSTKTAQR